jgi:hypothetical protein
MFPLQTRMRRLTRLGLIVFAAVLVAAGAYSAFWLVAASRIERGLIAWARSALADRTDISWQMIRVTGFPIALRVNLASALLRDGAVTPPPQLRIPVLSGSARPWDLAVWRLTAPLGFEGDLGAGGRAAAKFTAQSVYGVVSIETEGGWKLRLTLRDAAVEAGARVLVSSAHATITAPPKPSPGHTDPVTVAVEASRIKLPAAIGPLGDIVDELDFDVTVKGVIPNGKLADALAAWRDAGGTIDLDTLRLKWGALSATATGTIALDQELQPIGDLSGAIQGYDQILTTLVQTGHMRASDAGLARIALTLLAKAGPDGKPQIRTAFTIQNGQMFLGPAKLGKAPRLNWE